MPMKASHNISLCTSIIDTSYCIVAMLRIADKFGRLRCVSDNARWEQDASASTPRRIKARAFP